MPSHSRRQATVPAPASAGPGLWRAGVLLLPSLIGAVWLAGGLGRFGRLGFPMDDPYIHFQFARNLAAGAGFSFNPHEAVPGATGPLWVVLLAATRLLGLPTEPAAAGLGLAAAALACLLAFEVGVACGVSRTLAALAALATGAAGRFTWGSLSGMETCLAAALSLALIRVQLSQLHGWRRGVSLGLLAGLAANTRPELALLGAVVGLHELFVRPQITDSAPAPGGRARPARTASSLTFFATFALALAPYVLFCLTTSGRPLPNTFYAKSLIPLAMGNSDAGAARASYLPDMLRWVLDDNLLLGVLLIPGLLLWWRRRGPPEARLLALWPILFWIYALALYPRHFSLSRYTIPLIPFLALVATEPLAWLLARLRGRAARPALALAAALLCILAAVRSQTQLQPVYLAQVENVLRMQVAMGEWVAAHLPPDARLATNDVGAITWYGGRYCVDTVGLVNSSLIRQQLEWLRRFGRVDVEGSLRAYLARDPPDYCILFPAWYPNLCRAPGLSPVYGIRFRNVTGGGDELVVFRVVGRL